MVDFAGLSATYPGFLEAQGDEAKNRKLRSDATTGEDALASQEIIGRTFQSLGIPPQAALHPAFGGTPQGGQAPMPGQPSMPMGQPMQQGMPGATPMPQGVSTGGVYGGPEAAMNGGGGSMPVSRMPGPQAPPQASPTGFGGGGQLDWQQIAQKVVQANPGANPRAIAGAIDKLVPLMKMDSANQWKELSLQLRLDAEQGRNARAAASEAGKQGRFDARETRLTAAAQARQDVNYQKLELQKKELERKIQQGGDKLALSQWRAVVDAQNKITTNIVRANMMGAPASDVQDVLNQQEAETNAAILNMQDQMAAAKPAAEGGLAGVPGAIPVTPNVKPITDKLDSGEAAPAAAPAAPTSAAKKGTYDTATLDTLAETLKRKAPGSVATLSDKSQWILKAGRPYRIK